MDDVKHIYDIKERVGRDLFAVLLRNVYWKLIEERGQYLSDAPIGSSVVIIARADTFSDRKSETSKCCDISFDLLMIKTSSAKQVERRDHIHLRTLSN